MAPRRRPPRHLAVAAVLAVLLGAASAERQHGASVAGGGVLRADAPDPPGATPPPAAADDGDTPRPADGGERAGAGTATAGSSGWASRSAAALLALLSGASVDAQDAEWFTQEGFKKMTESEAFQAASSFYRKFLKRADLDNDMALTRKEFEYLGYLTLDALTAETMKVFEVAPEGWGVGRSLADEEEAAAMFAEMDLNGDGRLDRYEVREAVKKLMGLEPGDQLSTEMRDWADMLFKRADVSGNGYLNRDEAEFFRYLVREVLLASKFGKPKSDYMEGGIRGGLVGRLFKELDKNGDGKIDLEDLQNLFSAAGGSSG